MQIIIYDKKDNYLCTFNVFNNHKYFDDDVEIQSDSLKDCEILIPQRAKEEFYQLRNDDIKFSDLYSENDLNEWYFEQSNNKNQIIKIKIK